ncbi:MAG: Asp-tRNA(Asn)/Glu-tRNA(Gln) amidotransferase subunit GatA [Deltaproteobacteria bacterium]|nr:Asp-tRNA(Asn)/Glu-tRNA(Gln) amidotransferase subunit GatA [Deltaproteobacteria bacterium]
MELCDRSASDLADMLKKGDISSREITESVFKRIDEDKDSINAFITLDREGALKQADIADKRFSKREKTSPLNGIPIAVKDNICTKKVKTTCGSKILNNYMPMYNATVIERVIREGAVIVGKTNMDEFAMGSSNENSSFGPVLNPLDPERVPGGSSGGSAAAVAAGQTVLALGSDTGGSIRQPASFCGIAGMKPTYGRVSRFGLISYASSLDQIGPLCRTVEDCSILLNCICGFDENDTTSANIKTPDFTEAIKKDINGIRIGLPKEYFIEGLDNDTKESVMGAVKALNSQGAEIVDISLPHTRYAISTYYLIATAEASSNLSRYDGVRYGIRAEGDASDIVEMYERTRSEGFGSEVKRRIMLGTYVLSAGYYEAYYLKAQKVRALIKNDFEDAFKSVDCIITPTSPSVAFNIGEKIDEPLQMYLVDIYTVSLNLAGLPGISVDCSEDGLPVGLQIIGGPFDEEMVLRVAYAYQLLKRGR